MTLVDRVTGIETSAAIKVPVRVATTANITLSGEQTIDGVAVVAGDRVLVKDQTNAADNGIWVVSTSAWSRAVDMNETRDAVEGTQVRVTQGTLSSGLIYKLLTTGTISVGTTALTWGSDRLDPNGAYFTPEQYGAQGDGSTDDQAALQAAINAAEAAGGGEVYLSADYYCGSSLTINQTVRIRGMLAARVVNNGTAASPALENEYLTGITFAAGAAFEIISDIDTEGATDFEDITIKGGQFRNFFIRDEGAGSAPANRQSYDAVPLLTIHRSSDWLFEGVEIDGAGRRRYGAVFGEGNTIWNTTILLCRFRRCQVGAVIGGDNDATDMHVVGCTFDQNYTCGAVLWNWAGGTFMNNSCETNDGPVGLFVRSTSTRTKVTNIMGNYIFRNAQNAGAEDLAGSTGIQIGGDLAWSDFASAGVNTLTSSTNPWGVSVIGNYIVNDECRYAVITYGQRGTTIFNNIVVSNDTTKAFDIFLGSGADGDTIISRNILQNAVARDRVEVDNSAGYRSLMERESLNGSINGTLDLIDMTAAGEILFDDVGKLTARGVTMGEDAVGSKFVGRVETLKVTGAADTWTTVFDVSADMPDSGRGICELLLAIEQTDGGNQSVHKFLINTGLLDAAESQDEAMAYSEEWKVPTLYRDNQVYQISGDMFQVKRTNAWQATVTRILVDMPFTDS